MLDRGNGETRNVNIRTVRWPIASCSLGQNPGIESHPKPPSKHAQNVSFQTFVHHLWGGVHDSMYPRNVALRLVFPVKR